MCKSLTLIATHYENVLFACRLTKIGAVVFLLHDVNDIFMECAKMARYTGGASLPRPVLFQSTILIMMLHNHVVNLEQSATPSLESYLTDD